MCDKERCCGQRPTGQTVAPSSQTRAPRSLGELGSRLRQIYRGDAKDFDVKAAQELMESYLSDNNDWRQYALFDKRMEKTYTRNLVDEGNGHFNLIVLCWSVGSESSIHSHANSHCLMKILDGTLKEHRYDRPEPGSETTMQVKEEFLHSRDQVAYINDSMGLHCVENPSHSEGAVSLHLYSPPLQECDCFDQHNGKSHKAQMTFWSKFGVRADQAKGQEGK